MKFLRFFPLLIILLIACEQKETVQTPDEFVVITEEIVENYDSVLVDTEYITYEYAGENDYFWQKKVVKDTAGNVIKVVEREFDQNGMPIKEVVTDEIGTQIDKAVLKYDPKTMELIQKDQYEGEIADENKTRTVIYHYDEEGYLISEEVKVYTEDDSFQKHKREQYQRPLCFRLCPIRKIVQKEITKHHL
jgi:hypothetical protein